MMKEKDKSNETSHIGHIEYHRKENLFQFLSFPFTKMNPSIHLSSLLSFILAFSTTLFIITFLLKIPHIITGHPELIQEYYFKNFSKNVPLDFFFVFVYFQIALFIIHQLHATSHFAKISIHILVTVLLTGGFCIYFRYYPMTSSFFSRWFHIVGYRSVIYDVLLLVFTFLIYDYIQNLV